MLRTGLVCLLIGNITHAFVHPATGFWKSVAMAITFTMWAISFPLLLLSVRRKALLRGCHAPDHVADVVRDEQRPGSV